MSEIPEHIAAQAAPVEVMATQYGPLQIRLYEGPVVRADNFPFTKLVKTKNFTPVSGTPTQSPVRPTKIGGPRNDTSLKLIIPSLTTTADDVYEIKRFEDDNIRYFSLTREEVVSYARRKAPYIRTFKTTSPLRLLDMQNPSTRETLLRRFSGDKQITNAIKTAFQEKNGRIYRFSSIETQSLNDMSLKSICELNDVDGYYTPKESTNPLFRFHSEIGLCRKAFHKLQLVHTEKSGLSAMNNVGISWQVGNPSAGIKRTKRNNNNNNNTKEPPKLKRFKYSRKSRKIQRSRKNRKS